MNPLIDSDATVASYNSCFSTTNVQLADENHLYVLSIDLKDSFFMHAILIVQETGRGIHAETVSLNTLNDWF